MGSIIETSIYGFCGLYLFNFYTDVVHLSPVLIGYAFFVRFFIDAFSDPAIGYISDRTKSQRGRRRPYFRPGVLIGIIAFFMLLNPPLNSSENYLFFYLMITSSFLFLGLTIFGIPYFALSWELSTDYEERTRISSYRRVFEVIAEIFSNLLIPVLLALSIKGYQTEQSCYPLAAFILGMIAAVSVTITYIGTSNYDHSFTAPGYSVKDGFLFIRKNKPFLILLATFTLVAVADRTCMALLFYILEFLHGIPKKDAIPLFLIFFLGSLVSPGLWMLLANYTGKKMGYILSIFSWGLVFSSFALINWNPEFLYGIVFLMGAASSGVLTLPGAIIPDVIEYDQVMTGQRREGIYAGSAKFFWKIGTSSSFLVIGYLLENIGYEGGKVPSESTLFGLRAIFILGPSLLLVGAMVIFSFYPITESFYNRISKIAHRKRQRASNENS